MPPKMAPFTGLAKQSYRAGEDIDEGGKKEGKKAKEEREDGKEEREKKGSHRMCAKAGAEHATVTTVRLGAHYCNYGALGSTVTVTTVL